MTSPADDAPAVPAVPAVSVVPPPLDADAVAIQQGYTFDEPTLALGVAMIGDAPRPDVPVGIPLAMLNRHGLIAGATGTGKTKTLQLLAEQLSAAGVAVVAADVKGDLSGLAGAGEPSERLTRRTAGIGQDWRPTAYPCEFFALGGEGVGVPLRATVSAFGPVLLAKVLGLNETQESSLGLIFHYADTAGLPLLDLSDLRALVQYLTSDEGKAELKGIGGISTATAGVILREITAFAAQGAEAFFGEPEFDTADLLRTADDGRGIVSLIELPELADRPALFSTFLMWLLADLFADLPEIGDADRPKLVFFLDEAHLLFADASKAFLTAITQTVRLIRSKGVGVFFVTQTPADVPDDVLAQLGSRVQHQLRAHTPRDAKALKQTVQTFPTSSLDLAQVLQQLGIGEAVVTVMDPDGAPTPVAWTRLRAPQSLMAPTPPEQLTAAVAASGLQARYGTAIDRDSAREMLARKLEAGAATAAREQQPIPSGAPAPAPAPPPSAPAPAAAAVSRPRREEPSMIEQLSKNTMVRQLGRTVMREVMRGIFGVGRRR